MGVRDKVENAMARAEEWGTDTTYSFSGTKYVEDMSGWDDDQWTAFEWANGEKDITALLDIDLSRLENYI